MEFMQALREELHDISSEEREAALQYYNDYLDDAGPEDEQNILREWGSPKELAESIRSGMEGRMENGEFTENGFSTGKQGQYPERYSAPEQGDAAGAEQSQAVERKPKQRNGWKILAIVLLCIILAPICLPIGFAAVIIVFALLVSVVAVVGALAAAGVALFVCGVIIAYYGVTKVFITPAGAAVFFGSGLVLTAVGAVLTVLFCWLFVKCAVWMFRKCVDLCRRPFYGRK